MRAKPCIKTFEPWCRYKEAAQFRDMLAQLDLESKKAAAQAAEWSGGQTGPRLRLGQRVVHMTHGYRWGVCMCAWGCTHAGLHVCACEAHDAWL